MQIFNRKLLNIRRNQLADLLPKADFLIRNSFEDIYQRVRSLERNFTNILNLGSRIGYGSDLLRDLPGAINLINTDLAYNLVNKSPLSNKLVCDEEYLPFKPESFDLIVSILNLHHVNDLSSFFRQLRKITKSNCAIFLSLFGENNLQQLFIDLQNSELALTQNFTARISPMVSMQNLTQVMQNSGFKSFVIDKNYINVEYADSINLFKDLKYMGENNILYNQNPKSFNRSLWLDFLKKRNYQVSFCIITISIF